MTVQLFRQEVIEAGRERLAGTVVAAVPPRAKLYVGLVLAYGCIGFTSSAVPERFRLLYSLNPMVGVIDGFRWALFGGRSQLYWPGFCLWTLS